ncbi:MAG: hypothetical protein BWY93_01530 [Euryarchaeota archaeon ADurb.BinA087]|nr:MAG: hypothetical protein BWY93_01530 [Euryarchaeota archaeon ADurb.BinA087]
MDHDTNMAGRKPVCTSRPFMKNLPDSLDFQEMISGPKGPALGHATLAGLCRNGTWIGTSHGSLLLAVDQIALHPKTLIDCPFRSSGEHPLKLFMREPQGAFCSHSGRDRVEKTFYQFAFLHQILFMERNGENPDAAIDIESNTPGGDDPLFN